MEILDDNQDGKEEEEVERSKNKDEEGRAWKIGRKGENQVGVRNEGKGREQGIQHRKRGGVIMVTVLFLICDVTAFLSYIYGGIFC